MDGAVEERVEVGGRTVTLLRPASAEALIDEEAFARDEFLPYWAELWPSAVALARHVSTLPLAGVRVLELGCGLALPAIVAALGGAEALATDWSEDALRLARANAERNGAPLETALLRFGEPEPLGRFDLVLAADVLYEERNADQLTTLLPRVVAPDGRALVADPGRDDARRFLEHARERWAVATIEAADLPRGGIHVLRPRAAQRGT